jgi:putative membrane protein
MTKQILRFFLSGFFMGSADLVPGVSGGTIALILGIYERLIKNIKLVTHDTLKLAVKFKLKEAFLSVPWIFLLPLFVGMMTAIASLSGLIEHLLKTQPIGIWSFFFGLVFASVFLVGAKVKKWRLLYVFLLVLTTLGAYFLVGLVPLETAPTLLNFFISGAIAITAMILPGISGSFMLIIMGKYSQLLSAVNNHDFLTLGVFMVGAVVGLALFSKFLNWLFDHYHDGMMAVLAGFLLGSLRKVWPWKEITQTMPDSHGEVVPVGFKNVMPNEQVALAGFLILVGVLIVAGMHFFSQRIKHEEPGFDLD